MTAKLIILFTNVVKLPATVLIAKMPREIIPENGLGKFKPGTAAFRRGMIEAVAFATAQRDHRVRQFSGPGGRDHLAVDDTDLVSFFC